MFENRLKTGNKSSIAQLVIACRACGHRPRIQIPRVAVYYVCLSICPSVWSSARILWFYVYLYGRPQAFLTGINISRRCTPTMEMNTNTYPVWGSSVAMHLSPKMRSGGPSGVQSSLYVRLYVCPSVCCVIRVDFENESAWSVIARSACGRYIYIYIYMCINK